MGFWPYFLQAHESDGGVLLPSPLSRDPSTLIGICTTLFCMAFLLNIDTKSQLNASFQTSISLKFFYKTGTNKLKRHII